MGDEEPGSLWMVLLGAGALLICCAGHLLAAGGVISLVWLASALQPHRALLLAASVALFGAAWYASRRACAACCESGSPSRARPRSGSLPLVLWILGAVLLIAVLASTAAAAGR